MTRGAIQCSGAAGFVDMTGRYATPLAGQVMTASGH